MKRCGFAGHLVLFGLSVLLSGCVIELSHPASATRNNAFIAYWPPPKDPGQVRLAVKDLIDLKGVVTTAGSAYFANNSSPAARDAACMTIARQRHVLVVGKTNLDELAVGVTGMNEYFGIPRNRLSRKHWLIPGGSSSGSAVAVQSDMADVAFGTDTAGSIRIPAACCGIVGLKTTFGLISLRGVFPLEPRHLDTIGPMGKDIAHVVEGMDLLEDGFLERYQAAVNRTSAGRIRVGRLYLNGTDPEIDRAVDDALVRAHFQIVRLDRNFKAEWEQAQKDATTVAEAAAWISNGKYVLKPGIGAKVKTAIAFGELQYTSYRTALRRRATWQRALRRAFRKVDFIALPTMQTLPPNVPFTGGTPVFEEFVLNLENTEAVNFAGNPALAMPVPVNNKNIPVTSLQLIGPNFSEARLLSVGRLVETGVHGDVESLMAAKSGHKRSDARLRRHVTSGPQPKIPRKQERASTTANANNTNNALNANDIS
ncbi:MAG: amidase [Verrucomicrobia bacterium]|nr:amidase [Verrucomicrobiota bacterium]